MGAATWRWRCTEPHNRRGIKSFPRYIMNHPSEWTKFFDEPTDRYRYKHKGSGVVRGTLVAIGKVFTSGKNALRPSQGYLDQRLARFFQRLLMKRDQKPFLVSWYRRHHKKSQRCDEPRNPSKGEARTRGQNGWNPCAPQPFLFLWRASRPASATNAAGVLKCAAGRQWNGFAKRCHRLTNYCPKVLIVGPKKKKKNRLIKRSNY